MIAVEHFVRGIIIDSLNKAIASGVEHYLSIA
jgi:hypothetical protein